MQKSELIEYCQKTYPTVVDQPFPDDFDSTVLRHADTKKWYALIMNVSRKKFGLDSDERVNIVNLKRADDTLTGLYRAEGVYPAYHMNKNCRVSVIPDDCSDELLRMLTDISYLQTAKKNRK